MTDELKKLKRCFRYFYIILKYYIVCLITSYLTFYGHIVPYNI